MKDILKKIALSASMIVALSACTGDFDEINTDPDAYSSAPNTNVLAYVLRSSAAQWTSLDIGQWAGYISEIQYLNDYSGYIPTNNTYGNRWVNTYRCYTQLQTILDDTEKTAEGNKNMRNVAKLWQNYLVYLNVTCFGQMPYSEAWQGPDILEPKYDDEEAIYTSVLANLKEVADSWASGFGSDVLGDGDFLFKGDVSKWQKFCNSLRVKVAMQISNVYSNAQSIVEEIINNQTTYPMITSNDEQAYFWWQGTTPYREPWEDNSHGGRDDDAVSDIFINHLKKMNDPRIASLAKPAKTDGKYRGMENGALVQPSDLFLYSRIGAIYRDDPKGFTPFFKACETYYMIAEAALKGWKTPITAKEAYTKGVQLSMADNKVSDADATAYLKGAGKFNNTLEQLYFEEWVGLFKENVSAWTLYRRTEYPTYIYSAVASDGVKKEYPGARSAYKDIHNDVPFRFPYPNNQYQYNKTNLEVVTSTLKDYVWGKKCWFDTRSDAKYY